MKFNHKLHRVMGPYYGSPSTSSTSSLSPNLQFTSCGKTLLSPALNRIQSLDLHKHTLRTLPFESRSNIRTMALSPNNDVLFVVDEDDHYQIVNHPRGVILHRGRFKRPSRVVSFSPKSGRYLAVSEGRNVKVWKVGGMREYQPLRVHRVFGGFGDDVSCMSWSEDESVLWMGSDDRTVKGYSVEGVEGFVPVTLSGHKDGIVNVFASEKGAEVYSVSKDGAVFRWELNLSFQDSSIAPGNSAEVMAASEESFKLASKQFFKQERSSVTACGFHRPSSLLSVGFSNGLLSLYELPSFTTIHSLSLSSHPISTINLNPSGEWISIGISPSQLLVWEWKSETFILKQSSHGYSTRTFAYHPNAQCLATGGEDGKVKLWNNDGFCYVTFQATHTAPVTSLVFPSEKVLLSASLDGTVRAHDLLRYKNFRTYTTPSPAQFLSLATSPSGEILAAGSMDPFAIYLWNLQNGQLLEVLTGHRGPISDLGFSPRGVVSASWDGTVKIWDVFGKVSGKEETLDHSHDVVCLDVRPDGEAVVTGMINGVLTFWDIESGKLLSEIDGKMDIKGGRKENDRMTVDNNAAGRYFTSVCYSADGVCVLAGGNSQYICIYEVSMGILIKKFVISSNRSLDGVLEELKSTNLGESGLTLPGNNYLHDPESHDLHLPGAKRQDDGTRTSRVEVLTTHVRFSPTGREFGAVSTEGVHIYSLDEDMIFDPVDLTEEVTPMAVQSALLRKRYATALRFAFSLHEFSLITQVLGDIPHPSIPVVVRSIHFTHLEKCLQALSRILDSTPHLEFYLEWTLLICKVHGQKMQKFRGKYMRAFRAVYKAIWRRKEELKKVWEENGFVLDFVSVAAGKIEGNNLLL